VTVATSTPGSKGWDRPTFAARVLISLAALELLQKLVEPA
jgi:hypothetical protein